MLQIKRATINNAELIADISRETFVDTFAQYNTQANMDKFLSGSFSKKTLIAEVSETDNTFFLAYENDHPAGYVFLKENTFETIPKEHAIEISRLYVRTDFIGKGVGKALMQASISHAFTENKTFIWLGVWEHNPRAIQFYTSFGFEKIAEQNFILGNDVQKDWVMRLVVCSL
jgi:ribosomal protein S18 acetylase RimI-like enzyme